MKFSVKSLLLSAGLSLLAAPALAAGSVVKVSLWDQGPKSMDGLGQGVMRGMGMTTTAMPMAMLGIDVASSTVKAGAVTFEVTNTSKHMVHEMVIAPVADEKMPLPYDKSLEKVNEDAAGHLGEVAELNPGQSGALKITLKPGKYILYCNISGHYALGMWKLVTVKQ